MLILISKAVSVSSCARLIAAVRHLMANSSALPASAIYLGSCHPVKLILIMRKYLLKPVQQLLFLQWRK